MPSGYHINHEQGLVTLTGSNTMQISDACDIGSALLADPEFDSTLPHLVDLRGLELQRDQASSARFRRFVLDTYMPRVKASIAVVVNDSLDQNSLAGLYHICCSMERTELFDQYDQALKWLMRREFA
ncbi:MAG: hypothetical protein AAF993_04290 [Pseudomonadota bacterium]